MIASFGARYRFYCSNVGRTLVVQPHESVEQTYEVLLEAEEALIQALRPGNALSQAYEAAVNVVQEKRPHLVGGMPKTFG